ncbi:uncharacterized protein LOC119080786 [Bradysia coprophila]|uniref:uncharacterized protein LOC119080786 n=1 Tax=Bradysia coprophila TaxID=38358 RepID=UPI00187D8FC8|nr:uncharacterized protein LOC119080786 [Bradysia coprophila]
MVQGPNFMKIDVICLRHRPDMLKNAINVKITSSAEITMDEFDGSWPAYTRATNFFAYYRIHNRKQRHLLQSWYSQILGSQFNYSSDRHDTMLLDHWTIDIGNEDDFIVDGHKVPFHAIIKTPAMEYFYAQTNVACNPKFMVAYTGEARRIPLFDEHKVVQPYYHSNPDCSVLNNCTELRNCYRKIEPIRQVQAVMTESERLAEEVF